MSTKSHSSRSKKAQVLPYQMKEIEMAFEKFDTNKNGEIDKRELYVALKALGLDVQRSDIPKIMKKYGLNGETISHEWFRDIAVEYISKKPAADESARIFGLLDVDKNGKVTADDLHGAMRSAGINMEPKLIEQMIAEFAKDGNDYITVEEFKEIMKPTSSY